MNGIQRRSRRGWRDVIPISREYLRTPKGALQFHQYPIERSDDHDAIQTPNHDPQLSGVPKLTVVTPVDNSNLYISSSREVHLSTLFI